jgi:hypothetical protein
LCYADNENWAEDVEQHDRDSDPRIVLSCLYRKILDNNQQVYIYIFFDLGNLKVFEWFSFFNFFRFRFDFFFIDCIFFID